MSHSNKYHKGQTVIFIAKSSYGEMARDDSGKIATIVECFESNYYDIFIQGSQNNEFGRKDVTWHIPEETLRQCEGQLLFAFMQDG